MANLIALYTMIHLSRRHYRKLLALKKQFRQLLRRGGYERLAKNDEALLHGSGFQSKNAGDSILKSDQEKEDPIAITLTSMSKQLSYKTSCIGSQLSLLRKEYLMTYQKATSAGKAC